MTQPTPYDRQHNFTDFSATFPSLQQPGAQLDAEFNAIEETLDDTLANLALIQKDDTTLRNGIVGLDQFSEQVLAFIASAGGWNVRGAWATSTGYAVGDLVVRSGVTYLVMVAHTSGTFSTDLASGKLTEFFGATSTTVADRDELAAISSPANGDVRFIAETNRTGMFKFLSASALTQVAADTYQGIYVPPDADASGATGAWVRQFDSWINWLWFDIVSGNTSGANGAANHLRWLAMLATMRTRAINSNSTSYGLEPVRSPQGYFEFASPLDFTDGTFIFEGAGNGFPGSGNSTLLKFPTGITGLRTQRFNSEGASTTSSPTHRGGDGMNIRNFTIQGGYNVSGTEQEAHGVHLRSRARLDNLYILGFEGDGIYGHGAGASNSNNTKVISCRIEGCRNGVYVDGGDANIYTFIGVDCSANRQWGFADSCFLGSSYFGCHVNSNGLVANSTPCIVSDGTNRYGVIAGQEAGASTNAPSGTTDDNTWWYWLAAGGTSSGLNIANWSSGATYRAGGAYHTDDSNAAHVFVGCYRENGQGKSQLVGALVLGGFMGRDDKVRGVRGAVIWEQNGYINGNLPWRGAHASNFSAAPTTGAHTRGDVVFNSLSSLTAELGWFCRTTGTPGTWAPFYPIASLTVTSSGLTMATAKILGRSTASTGVIEEITPDATTMSLAAGTLSATGSFPTQVQIAGTKVIGAQAAAVADAAGGATVDAEARTALNALLARLRTHGLIAT